MLIVFDLDDTLARTEHRQGHLNQEPKNWDAYFDACEGDVVNPDLRDLLLGLSNCGMPKFRIEIWTGRPERLRDKTRIWLWDNGFPHVELRMRDDGDFRQDIDVKAEWMETYGKPALMFDDRTKSVQFWRSLGITVCQVADNSF